MNLRECALEQTRDCPRNFRTSPFSSCPRQHKRGRQCIFRAMPQQKSFRTNTAAPMDLKAGREPGRLQMPFGSRGPKKRVGCKTVQALHGHAAAGGNLFAILPALVIAACTAVVFLATVVICVFLLLRPLLKRLESLAVACESAAKEVEKASAEFALASVVINNDLPTTLDSMERASLEFEELGQSLNGLTGVLRRSKPSPPKPGVSGRAEGPTAAEGNVDDTTTTAGEASAAVALTEMSAVEAIQASTINSMRKVAQDVSALAAALSPAMIAWRKRLGFITERFDMAKPDDPQELPPALAEAEESAQDRPSKHVSSIAAPTEINASKGSPREKPLDEEVQTLQEKVMSQAESGEVGSVANELAKAATEVADVARKSLSSTDEEQAEELRLSPQAHQEGADLLEKAAKAAEALTREAQRAAEVESKFKALKDVAPLTDDFKPIYLPSASSRGEGLEGEMEDRRMAAQAVFTALANAEEAASAAAAASGALENALQKAEQQAGVSWWGWGGGSLFRSSPKKQRTDTVEAQEHDGMAYPCSRYIASREVQAAPSGDVAPAPSTSSEAGNA